MLMLRPSAACEVPFEICENAIVQLENHDWYGNFRELLNFATHLAVECIDEDLITGQRVRSVLGESSGLLVTNNIGENYQIPSISMPASANNSTGNVVTVTFDSQSLDLDSIYVKAAGTVIKHTLQRDNGNLRRAAREMGATDSTLSRILKKYNERANAEILEVSSTSPKRFAMAA